MGNCAIYADDTTIYAHSENLKDLSNILQHEVMQISEWVTENKMKLNISKTKCLVICSDHAQKKEHLLNISLEGVPIEQVKEARLLGVTIDERLSWATHINNIITKMSRSISIIRRSAYFLTNTTIKQVIQSLVLSHLDYCPAIWSNASKQELNKIQLTQNRAARLALHCSFRTSIEKMHNELSWMKVNERLACSLILFFKNIYTLHKPFYLYSELLLACESHNYGTRHALRGAFTQPKPKSDALKKTVLYRAITYWNRLPKYLVLINSRIGFKNRLKGAVFRREIVLDCI